MYVPFPPALCVFHGALCTVGCSMGAMVAVALLLDLLTLMYTAIFCMLEPRPLTVPRFWTTLLSY